MAEIKISRKKASKNIGTSSSDLSIFERDFSLFGNSLSDKWRLSFLRNLGVMLKSGIPILQALELQIIQEKNTSRKSKLQGIQEELIKGSNLSDAIAVSKGFSEFELNTLRTGEQTGQLQTVLDQIIFFLEQKIKLRSKVISALTYPVVVLSFAFLAIFFMLKFVIPMFTEIFKRFDGQLPAITKYLISLSNFADKYYLWLFLFLLILAIGIRFSWGAIVKSKLASAILTSMPFIKTFVSKVSLSRVCRSLSLQLASDIPINKALTMTAKSLSLYHFKYPLEFASTEIEQGTTLYDILKEHKVFPARFLTMTKIGEEANSLPFMYKNLADNYDVELEGQVSLITTLLEPLIIVVLGLIVGVILLAMYLPLFQMSTTIS